MSLVSFCDLAHNVFAENQREQSRLVFKRALVVSAARAFASIRIYYPEITYLVNLNILLADNICGWYASTMPKVKITVWGFRCGRCQHEWVPRDPDSNEEPRYCPKCKSPYWNKPRRYKVAKAGK
jgi:hypothetical protein